MDLHLFISDGFDKTKINDKRDGFDFYIVKFPFPKVDVPHPMVFIFLNIIVLLACPDMLITIIFGNKVLTAKILKQ